MRRREVLASSSVASTSFGIEISALNDSAALKVREDELSSRFGVLRSLLGSPKLPVGAKNRETLSRVERGLSLLLRRTGRARSFPVLPDTSIFFFGLASARSERAGETKLPFGIEAFMDSGSSRHLMLTTDREAIRMRYS